MEKTVMVIGWLFTACALVAGLDNLFFQPAMPGLFIGGSDLVSALMAAIVLLDRVHHVFDIRK